MSRTLVDVALAYLYGLPKVHEIIVDVDFHMHPSLAAYSTPSYSLAKFLAPLLTSFFLTKYCATNSSSFSKEICEYIHISGDSFLASPDIRSLYTNAPLLKVKASASA